MPAVSLCRGKLGFGACVATLSGALLYAACFTLLVASNRRLRLFSGDIVSRTTVNSPVVYVFGIFPLLAVLLALVCLACRPSQVNRRLLHFSCSLLLLVNVVATAVWHVVAFRSTQQFFEFAGLGSGCPDGGAGEVDLPPDSDFENYCVLVATAFWGCYGAMAFVAAAQCALACVLLRTAKRHRARSR